LIGTVGGTLKKKPSRSKRAVLVEHQREKRRSSGHYAYLVLGGSGRKEFKPLGRNNSQKKEYLESSGIHTNWAGFSFAANSFRQSKA